ncbi:MAG: NAD-dependent epimerase/dehydratase family protein [Thermodesulfobacteriota bacterium]
MKVYVTGGSGFLGRPLIEKLVAQGKRVTALAMSAGDAEVVRELGAEPVIGTLHDTEILRQSMAQCDAVIHLAALMKLFGNWNELFSVNVDGMRNILAVANNLGVRRFIYVSAAGVLCDGSPVVDADETRPRPKKPVGAYAGTKAIAERSVLEANCPGFEVVVVRPPCLWGKGDLAMLPTLSQMVRDGKWKWINKGDYPYSVCHVKNACEGVIKALDKGRGGEIYFVADGGQTSFRDVFDPLLRTQDVDPGEASMPLWLVRAIASVLESVWRFLKINGEPPIARDTVSLFFTPLSINDSKARQELGYEGSVTLKEGLAELKNA